MRPDLPLFPDPLRKNDGLFMFGATQPLPFVYAYECETIEVVHGPACKPVVEVDLDMCRQRGVPVVARRGGGGTVVLSPGVVVIVVVVPKSTGATALEIFKEIHTQMILVLDPDGTIGIVQRGISDLAICEKKVLGSSLYLPKGSICYYQSSLLVSSDNSLFESLLRHPPKEPDYRYGRAHHDFCTTLASEGARQTAPIIVDNINRTLPLLLSNNVCFKTSPEKDHSG